MSLLLDHGPHTVTVYPERLDHDSRGNVIYRPATVGVRVRGVSMQPEPTQRIGEDGRAHARYRMMARTAPIGKWSRVEWQGRRFSVISGPSLVHMSPGTEHVTAILNEER